jgi:hypothetical protein
MTADYPARSPIAVIIDRFAGDRQLFWVFGRYIWW